MQEIFEDIRENVREEVHNLITIVSKMHNLPKAMELIELYRNTLSAREQDYMDFVFQSWMEANGIHESIID